MVFRSCGFFLSSGAPELHVKNKKIPPAGNACLELHAFVVYNRFGGVEGRPINAQATFNFFAVYPRVPDCQRDHRVVLVWFGAKYTEPVPHNFHGETRPMVCRSAIGNTAI